MEKTSIFEELRSLDDHDAPRTLRFADTRLPLWPFVRWIAFCAAQETALQVQGLTPGARLTMRQRIELLARSQLRGPMSARRRFDIVMVGTSGGIVIERDGRWFDRINDYFAVERAEQTLVLDMALDGAYKTPRFPPHVRCYDTFDFQASVLARLRRPSDADLASIEKLVGFIHRFPVAVAPAAIELIRATLVRWAVRLPFLRRSWARFFDRVQPRVLFVEGGSYGNFAHLNQWACEAGIATAEIQHGLISRAHLAYNYGDAARKDASLAQALPRYLLVYGEVWKREVRTPSEVVVAGSPHFAESARPATRLADGATVLISGGFYTDLMVRAAGALARRFPDRAIVFRPHPRDAPFRDKYLPLAQLPNVELAERGDLYGVLERARLVIGHSSTALIEAAGLGLPVVIFEDELSRGTIPEQAGTWVRSIDDLLSIVESAPQPALLPDEFFVRDWRDRYHAFLSALPRPC